MKKIDPTVLKETGYIATMVFILSLLLQSVFLRIGKWDYTVLLGNIFGGAVAVVNFLLMGITVQKAVLKDEKEAATLMKLSQTLRNMMLLITCVVAIAVPFMNGVAAVIPLFFPRIAISLIPLRDRKAINGKVEKNGE